MDGIRRNLAVVACFAMLGVACGGGSGSGSSIRNISEITKDDIKVGAIFDLSGPTADVGVPYSEGIRDYILWRNQQGGIDGHRLTLSWQDFAYKVPNGEQLYSQFVSQGAVAFMGWGTADTEALRPRVTKDKVPFMSASYAATLADPRATPYNFFPGISYSEQMRLVLNHIARESEGRHVEVAVFHHDSPFGTSPLEDGRRHIADKKLDIGFRSYAMPAGAIDFVAQISMAKAQNASWVIIQNASTGAAKLATNIAAAPLPARIVCLNYCGDELYIKLAGPAAEMSLGVMPFAPPAAAGLSGLRDLSEFLSARNTSVEAKGLRYVQGWFTMATMARGMENGLRIVGDRKLDGPAIKAGLEQIDGFETGGVSEPIRFSERNHAGLSAAPLYEVQNGKWVKLTDPIEP